MAGAACLKASASSARQQSAPGYKMTPELGFQPHRSHRTSRRRCKTSKTPRFPVAQAQKCRFERLQPRRLLPRSLQLRVVTWWPRHVPWHKTAQPGLGLGVPESSVGPSPPCEPCRHGQTLPNFRIHPKWASKHLFRQPPKQSLGLCLKSRLP